MHPALDRYLDHLVEHSARPRMVAPFGEVPRWLRQVVRLTGGHVTDEPFTGRDRVQRFVHPGVDTGWTMLVLYVLAYGYLLYQLLALLLRVGLAWELSVFLLLAAVFALAFLVGHAVLVMVAKKRALSVGPDH